MNPDELDFQTLYDCEGEPVDTLAFVEDGVTRSVELDFVTDAARLRDHDEEAFNELWHLLELLLDRMPSAEGMDA